MGIIYYRDYLQAESLDKKKQSFDMSDWSLEVVKVRFVVVGTCRSNWLMKLF